MNSPLVLKAIYSLEHAQSIERMAQTLLLLRVPPDEVDDLAQDIPGAASANWMTMAERIATERATRGVPVVSPDLLRAANAMVAKRDTVRIHIQDRVNIAPPSQQGAPSPAMVPRPFPLAPPGVNGGMPTTPGGVVISAVAVAPARRITAVVLPPPTTVRRSGPAPWSVGQSAAPAAPGTLGGAPGGPGSRTPLRAELEEATRLLAANPSLESSALTPTQKEALRESLRPLLALAGGGSMEAGLAGALPRSEQKPISLRPQVNR